MKLLVCWILLSGVIASYEPTQAQTVSSDKLKPQATKTPKKSETDQRGTEQSPLIIKILPTANGEEKPPPIPDTRESDAPTDWGLITNILLALFSGGLFYATWKLSGATKSLVKGAEDTARRQLRAYVSLQIEVRPYPPDNPNRYAFALIVTNGGKTLARNLTIQQAVVTQDPNDLTDPFDRLTQVAATNSNIISPMVLGPGQKLDLQLGEIALSQVPQLAHGQIRQCYVVLARYQDTVSPSSVTRQTQLSCRLNADLEGGVSFTYLPTHNCADEDCPA